MSIAPFTTHAILIDELDDGTELELEVTIWFRICPAEPDVGIMSEHAEIYGVSVDLEHLGEILIEPHERYEDQLCEAANCAIDDLDPFHPDY